MRRYLLLLCFFPLLLPELTADWYRSDALGRPAEFLQEGDRIDESLKENEEYLLFRNESPEGFREELYRYGIPVREKTVRNLSAGRREETVLEGSERRISLYEGSLPVREEIYLEDTLERVLVYGWEGIQLKFLEAGNGAELLYRQEYFRDPRGRLRTLLRHIAGDKDPEAEGVRVIQYGYREGSLAETWVGDYNEGVRTRFAGLQALEETRMSGTSVVGRIERETLGENQVERSYALDGSLVSMTIRGPGGRTLMETIYLDGGRVREREYRYGGDLLMEMVIREPERLERRVYTYQNDTLRKEEVFVNRRLVKVSLFEGDRRLEEFYRRGEVITRRRYEGDSLVSEESYE